MSRLPPPPAPPVPPPPPPPQVAHAGDNEKRTIRILASVRERLLFMMSMPFVSCYTEIRGLWETPIYSTIIDSNYSLSKGRFAPGKALQYVLSQ